MTIQKINDKLSIGCEVWNRGNSAWGHRAKAFYNGEEVASRSVRYYNRTWEAYQFDTAKSLLMDVLDNEKVVPLADRVAMARFINGFNFT